MSDIFEEIVRLRQARRPAALATVVRTSGSTPAKVPARMLIPASGPPLGTIGGGCVEAEVLRVARDVMDTSRPRLLTFRLAGEEAERTGIACGGMLDIMVESLMEPELVLFGAGHVAQAVAPLARSAGFRVTVVDDRPEYCNERRFPDADTTLVADLDRLGDAVRVGPESYLISMTRGHAEDLTVLRWALTSGARYLGVLGSRAKRVAFLESLAAEGWPTDVAESIHMPVGLDLGAESVQEIAVAIVAELIRERRSRRKPLGG